MEQQGVPLARQLRSYEADLRYAGQALSLPVTFDVTLLNSAGLDALSEKFGELHEQLFTFKFSDLPVELVNCRARIEEVSDGIPVATVPMGNGKPAPEALKQLTSMYVAGKQYPEAPVWERSLLRTGDKLEGPAIISEMDSNTLVMPGFTADIDEVGNILLHDMAEPSTDDGEGVVKLDAVTADIIESALKNAREEMDTLVTRRQCRPPSGSSETLSR